MVNTLNYILIILLAVIIVYFSIGSSSRKIILEHLYTPVSTTVAPSNIVDAGEGAFINVSCKKDQRLFKALDLDHTIRTEVKKVNHCNRPNTYLVKEPDGWWVFAKKDLVPGEELTIDYWDTPDFIRKPEPEWTC